MTSVCGQQTTSTLKRVFQVSSLKGKVALITGASSGIGAGTGVLFAKLGALLALNGRDEENLRKVARECVECGAAEVTRVLLPLLHCTC